MARKRNARSTVKPAPKSRGVKRGQKNSAGASAKKVLPVFLSVCIIFCLGVFVYLGYRSVTASDFFEVATVEVNGTQRASKENIKRLVAASVEHTGTWNADLPGLKAEIERQPFVRSAAVSRILPNGVRIDVFEHEPKAVVTTAGGNLLVDGTGKVLAKAEQQEKQLPFTIIGWDEAKSEKADKKNAERVKLYQKMLGEWRTYGIESKVKAIDLSDLRDPRAVIEDSGTDVKIAVGRESFGENLSKGIKAIVGKGEKFEAVNLVGTNMILSPRKVQR